LVADWSVWGSQRDGINNKLNVHNYLFTLPSNVTINLNLY